MWLLLPVELFDLCRLEENHGTAAAALLAQGAPPPVLAEAAAAALLAPAALPPVFALILSHFHVRRAGPTPLGKKVLRRRLLSTNADSALWLDARAVQRTWRTDPAPNKFSAEIDVNSAENSSQVRVARYSRIRPQCSIFARNKQRL